MSRQFYINFIRDEVPEMTADDRIDVLRMFYSQYPDIVYECAMSSHIILAGFTDVELLKNIFLMLCSRHNLDPQVLLD